MPPAALARPAGVVPGGGVCPFSRLPTPPSLSLTAPIPPAPLPGGKGENQSYFMQGTSPLASPGAEPGRRLQSRQKQIPGGGVPFFSPANPAFGLIFCPPSPKGKDIPPTPLPRRGRGRIKVISCKGLRPLHPRGLNPGGTCYPCRCGKLNGGLSSLPPANPALSLLCHPLSPQPPSPTGKGETIG